MRLFSVSGTETRTKAIRLRGAAMRTLLALALCANKHNVVQAEGKALAQLVSERFGIPAKTIEKHIATLQEHRMLFGYSHRQGYSCNAKEWYISKLSKGRPEVLENGPIGPFSIEDISNLLNVGTTTIKRAKKVQSEGIPRLAQAVEQGKVAVSIAATMLNWAGYQHLEDLEWLSEAFGG